MYLNSDVVAKMVHDNIEREWGITPASAEVKVRIDHPPNQLFSVEVVSQSGTVHQATVAIDLRIKEI